MSERDDSDDTVNGLNGSNGGDSGGDSGGDNTNGADGGLHFSDEELESALEGFEREFRDEQSASDSVSDSDSGSSEDAPAAQDPLQDAQGDFDEELQGLIGNKAKAAIIITRLASAELLAAFCQISDISARCVASDQGAVAVLRTTNGDAPESAARDLTTVIAGMAAVLAVNRADKLEATLYMQGNPGEHFAPPILFASAPAFVEDLMLGIATVDDLAAQDMHVVDSADMDHGRAMAVIAKHTRFGRGTSRIR